MIKVLNLTCFSCWQESSVGQPGRQADRVGQPHDEQGARDPTALFVGDDLRVRTLWVLRRLRGPRQHLLHLQVSHLFCDSRNFNCHQNIHYKENVCILQFDTVSLDVVGDDY